MIEILNEIVLDKPNLVQEKLVLDVQFTNDINVDIPDNFEIGEPVYKKKVIETVQVKTHGKSNRLF